MEWQKPGSQPSAQVPHHTAVPRGVARRTRAGESTAQGCRDWAVTAALVTVAARDSSPEPAWATPPLREAHR